jgi:hypothetical protein
MSADIIAFPTPPPAPDPLDCPVAVFAVKRLLEFVCYDHARGNLRPIREYQAILNDGIAMAMEVPRT